MKRVVDYPGCKNWCDETVNRTYLNLLRTNNRAFELI
jgi:hypothetical protein